MSDSSSLQVLNAIRRIVRALHLSSRGLEKTHGLSGAQLFTMQKLAGAAGLSVRELAERTHTDQSSVSVVVSRLVERGLIEAATSAHDARRRSLQLTPAGLNLLAHAEATPQEKMVQALAGFAPADRTKLAALLQKLVEEAGLAGQDTPMFFEEAKPATSNLSGRTSKKGVEP